MRHYHKVFSCCACVWLFIVGVACWSLMNALEVRAALAVSREENERSVKRATTSAGEAQAMEQRMPRVRKFLAEWEPHLRKGADEREVGLVIRTGLESLAQQRLGLVTDQATTPEPGKVLVGGKSWRVQRVSLRASGESLVALVTWLGEAQSSFPYARIESWELVSAGGSNCSLRAVLSQPLSAEMAEKKGGSLK